MPGAVRQRERAEPGPCTRDPAAVAATAGEDELEAAGVLALLATPRALGPRAPRVEAAFHCRLRRDAWVERRALHELGGYYLVSPGREGRGGRGGCPQGRDNRPCALQPDAEGAFRRGPGLNLTSGQYAAPVSGFYALAATLHVGEARRRGGAGAPTPPSAPAARDRCPCRPAALAEQPRRGPPRPRDRLRLLVCIQSRCQRNA